MFDQVLISQRALYLYNNLRCQSALCAIITQVHVAMDTRAHM